MARTARVALALAAAGVLGLPAATVPAAAEPVNSVSVVDNAFVRGVERPTLRVPSGRLVVFRWASRQSHGISVRSGPARFRASTRGSGTFAYRFRAAGTYRLVCPLHAPGMRMTVIVRRGR